MTAKPRLKVPPDALTYPPDFVAFRRSELQAQWTCIVLAGQRPGPDILAQLYVEIIPAVEDAIALKVKLLLGKTSEVSLPAFKVISPAIGKLSLFPVAKRLNAEEKKIMKMNVFIIVIWNFCMFWLFMS